MFKTLFTISSCSLLTACIVVDGTASGQIPNIVIQPQIPASTPVERSAQQTIYMPTPMPYPAQTWQQKVKIKTYDGRCVDFSRSNQRSIQTSHCHDGTNQHFIFHPDQSITVQGKCLDVAGKQKHDGAEVIAYTCNGQSNQKWYLDGQRIRSADTGKCLDIYNGKMKMYSCNQNRGQKFSFIAL